MDVGALLHNARIRAGTTQAELARRVDVTPSVISAYEHGAREPRAGIMFEILKALGVDAYTQAQTACDSLARDRTRDAQRSAELMEVLELAAQFPARHSPVMTYPIFGNARP